MFRLKIERLLKEFGIKQEAIIELIGSNRVTFAKKMANNSFSESERAAILNKYGALL
jgi:hypothetical protein